MGLLRVILQQFGLNKDRLRLEWVSAAEGERYAQVVNSFIERIVELGPSPFRKTAKAAAAAAGAAEGGAHG